MSSVQRTTGQRTVDGASQGGGREGQDGESNGGEGRHLDYFFWSGLASVEAARVGSGGLCKRAWVSKECECERLVVRGEAGVGSILYCRDTSKQTNKHYGANSFGSMVARSRLEDLRGQRAAKSVQRVPNGSGCFPQQRVARGERLSKATQHSSRLHLHAIGSIVASAVIEKSIPFIGFGKSSPMVVVRHDRLGTGWPDGTVDKVDQ
jgi:hypothetical protein